MSRGLELSPKYGVNPTMPVCFWCGNERGDIAFMGRMRSKKGAKDDLEAPKHMVLDYEPCKECAEMFKKGVRLIEATVFPLDGRPPISKDQKGHVYPTGNFFVIKAEAARNMFNDIDESALSEGKSLCLDEKVFEQVEQLIKAATNSLE